MAGGYPLVVNGLEYFSSEHLYQCFRFPDCVKAQRAVMAPRTKKGNVTKSPMAAKMKSKKYQKMHHTRKDFETVKVELMRYCLRIKLAQHWRRFGSVLLSTGNRPIVEESHRKDFWATKAVKGKKTPLVGENNLGLLLVELRTEYRAHKPDQPYVVQPLSIPKFTLMGKRIRPVTYRAS